MKGENWLIPRLQSFRLIIQGVNDQLLIHMFSLHQGLKDLLLLEGVTLIPITNCKVSSQTKLFLFKFKLYKSNYNFFLTQILLFSDGYMYTADNKRNKLRRYHTKRYTQTTISNNLKNFLIWLFLLRLSYPRYLSFIIYHILVLIQLATSFFLVLLLIFLKEQKVSFPE